MLEIFRIPPNLTNELINFSNQQNCYLLNQLDNLKLELQNYIGIYALYYRGTHYLYQCISRANQNYCCLPIYIGKAVPSGRRTGLNTSNQNLYSRLKEHRNSIKQGNGIEIDEFMFKVIAMEIDLVSWGESVMIRHFQPVWNQIIDGFGNHDPGSGRYQQRRSVWDLLHPGRKWADRLTNFTPLNPTALASQINVLCQASGQRLGCFKNENEL